MLDRLTPTERLPFVLHDSFAVSFDEIVAIVGCSTAAAQLANRARRRARSSARPAGAPVTRRLEIVEAFLTAAHNADFDGSSFSRPRGCGPCARSRGGVPRGGA